MDKNVSLEFVGDLQKFPKQLEELMLDLQEKSRNNKYKVYFAVSYGGRLEIVEAIKKLSQELTKKEIIKLTKNKFEKFLWTAELPDPEIIIRTGGHRRLSNFLSWKSSYSEIVFLNTNWPTFNRREFKKILQNYRKNAQINKGE